MAAGGGHDSSGRQYGNQDDSGVSSGLMIRLTGSMDIAMRMNGLPLVHILAYSLKIDSLIRPIIHHSAELLLPGNSAQVQPSPAHTVCPK